MVNMQEQMKNGFNHISREIRSLSSSVPPQITSRIPEKNQYDDSVQCADYEYEPFDKDQDIEDTEDIEEINSKFEDLYSEEDPIDEEAQKQFVKNHKKEIKVCFI